MQTRPLTLKPRNRKSPALGPVVRVEAVHLSPAGNAADLSALVNGAGLRDSDNDGLKEHGTAPRTMWQGTATPDLKLEFDLAEPVPLAAMEVWNFNAEWQTTNGLRRADVAVSTDGATWQTVLRAAELAEAEGTADYDEPTILPLSGVMARKVRLENLVLRNNAGKVGLGAVVFHQAAGAQAGPSRPEDGATGVGLKKTALEWVAGQGATEHRVFLGTARDQLAPLGTIAQNPLEAPELKPGTAYYWRVDEVLAGGRTVTGRVARFDTGGMVAWWKLGETQGLEAQDASGHGNVGRLNGPPRWAPDQGPAGRAGALELDGRGAFVDCGKSARFDFQAGMTVVAWVKVRHFDRSCQTLVAKGSGAWRLQRREQTDAVEFAIDGLNARQADIAGAASVTSKRSLNDGRWHQVVGLYDGQRLALYLDGQLQDSCLVQGAMACNDAPVMLGQNPTRRGRFFDGWLGDVRLYDYGLSEAEVQALYPSSAAAERASK